MRSPGVIYRRYRQLKKKLLYEKVSAAHRRIHKNCVYGCTVPCTDNEGSVFRAKICLYELRFNKGLSECTDPGNCNAFVLKWTKEKVVKQFEKEISNPATKKKLYPELSLMEWMLDKDLKKATEEPGFFGRIIISIIDKLENLLKSTYKKDKKSSRESEHG